MLEIKPENVISEGVVRSNLILTVSSDVNKLSDIAHAGFLKSPSLLPLMHDNFRYPFSSLPSLTFCMIFPFFFSGWAVEKQL